MPRTILLYDILITVLLFVVEYSSSWWWCSGTPLGCPNEAELPSLGRLSKVIRV